MTPKLTTVIEDTYRIFAHERLRGTLNVCTCPVCMSTETERALRTAPLRGISSSLLAEYTHSARGWDDEMRYFLPRYFELIALGDIPDPMDDIAQVLSRMNQVDWRVKWAVDEIETIEQFFDAYLTDRLNCLELAQWPVGWRLECDIVDVLAMIATSGGDIERVLRAWEAATDPAAAARHDIRTTPKRMFLDSPYLDEHESAADKIGEFLLRPEASSRVEGAFFIVEDPRLQQILSDGLC